MGQTDKGFRPEIVVRSQPGFSGIAVELVKSSRKQDDWAHQKHSNGHFGRPSLQFDFPAIKLALLRPSPGSRILVEPRSRRPGHPYQTPPQPAPVRRRLTRRIEVTVSYSANSIMALRCVRLSGRFEDLWEWSLFPNRSLIPASLFCHAPLVR